MTFFGFGGGYGFGSTGYGGSAPTDIPAVNFPLASNLDGKAVTGGLTFTRASSQIVADHEGVLKVVASGSAAFPGTRIVTNLLLNPATLSTQSVSLTQGGVYQLAAEGTGSIAVSGAATGTLTCESGKRKALRLTATYGTLTLTVTGTVTSAQLEFVTGQTNQNPGEYVATTSAPISKSFTYLNPHTVDANGVVTDSGARTAITTATNGILLEPARTNKVTCYSALTESLGSELSEDSSVVGRVYQITARTSIDWETNGTRLSGTANTVGATYVVTTAFTFTENDKAREILNAIGTKATNTSTTAIRGITLSGHAAAYAEIVDDSAALTAAGLGNICNGRVVKIDTAGCTTFGRVNIEGTTGNTNARSLSMYGRGTGWTGKLIMDLSSDKAYRPTVSNNYSLLKHENRTPLGTSEKIALLLNPNYIFYFILPQLEEGAFATSPIITQGATATRAAVLPNLGSSGNTKTSSITGVYHITPQAIGASPGNRWRFASYTDANNYIGVLYNGINVIFRKRVAGTNYDATRAVTESAGTTYKVVWRINADNSTDLFVNGTKGTGNANTTAPVFGTTVVIGSDGNSANYSQGQLKTFQLYHKPLSDAKCISITT